MRGWKIDPRDIRTIEVSPVGTYMMNRQVQRLDQIVAQLAFEHRRNPRLMVDMRGDRRTLYEYVTLILDKLEQAGIDSVSLRTQPPPRP